MKVLDHGFVELVDSMPAAVSAPDADWGPGDQRIVDAARISTQSTGDRERDKKLLRYLYNNRHTSPFEKVRFEFHVKLPIFVARQWIRHRTGSFNEQSARYSQLDREFYVPELTRMQAQSSSNKQASGITLSFDLADRARMEIGEASEAAYTVYENLLGLGLARELARMVLPVNFYTQWFWTVDLHNLMHFLRLRLHSHAQYEIRVYAEAIVELVRPIAPCALGAFEASLGKE